MAAILRWSLPAFLTGWADTTLVYRGPQILRGFDNEVRDHLAAEMAVKGVTIKTESDIAAIAKTDNGYTVTYQDGSMQDTGLVMYATGRVPMTDGLGLENAGVELGAKGEIKVDAYSKTNIDSIYAVGDVTARAELDAGRHSRRRGFRRNRV